MLNAMSTTLGARLRRARDAKHLTLEQVAGQVGRPISWYSTIETGRKKGMPEPLELRIIGDALDLTMPELLEAAGYLLPSDLTENRANPFERDDPRYPFVETLRRLDLSDEYDAYVAVTIAQLLRTLDSERDRFKEDMLRVFRPTRANSGST